MRPTATLLILAGTSAALGDDAPALFPAGVVVPASTQSPASIDPPALEPRPIAARPLGWPILRSSSPPSIPRLDPPVGSTAPPLVPSYRFGSLESTDFFLPPIDLAPAAPIERNSRLDAPILEPPAFAPFGPELGLPEALPDQFDFGDEDMLRPDRDRISSDRRDDEPADEIDPPKLDRIRRRRPLLGLLRPRSNRDPVVPPPPAPSLDRLDPERSESESLRRRVIAEAERRVGRHLKRLDVRVVEDDILIDARADWPWNRRKVRRDLEAIGVPRGRRLLVEVE